MTQPFEIWNEVIERASRSGDTSLSEHDRTILRVNRCLIDFENGGLSGLLYNVSPENDDGSWTQLIQIETAVAAVGQRETAELLRSARALVEAAPSGSGHTWSEFLRAVGADRLKELDEALAARLGDLWDALEVFTAGRSRAG